MEWVDAAADAELIEALWPDTPSSAPVAQAFLDAAQIQCEEFAPALAAEEVSAPANYKTACIMQAAALFKSGHVGGSDQITGDYPVRVFPMDWTVKALLRPAPGIPEVF